MAYDKKQWDLKEEDFGPLWEYVVDDNITDINLNCNGSELWVKYLDKGKKYIKDHECDSTFVTQFVARVSNKQSKHFNKKEPVLEAETGNLRISCVHDSVAISGISICIRKSPPIVRISVEKALKEKYFDEPIKNLLINCVRARMNFVFCGEPGVGKTECAKFFSQFIPADERVITIEDNPELHYKEINPGKDCVEFKIEDSFDYPKAIKTCLRQNPDWIMLSEARSVEVKYLLECWSTGVCGFTTLHTNDVRKIPDRIKNMMGEKTDAEHLENDIYSFVNVGILIRNKKRPDGTIYRYVDQVCFFTREGGKNRTVMVVEDGKMVKKPVEKKEGEGKKDKDGKKDNVFQPLPLDIIKRFTFAGIKSPLEDPKIK